MGLHRRRAGLERTRIEAADDRVRERQLLRVRRCDVNDEVSPARSGLRLRVPLLARGAVGRAEAARHHVVGRLDEAVAVRVLLRAPLRPNRERRAGVHAVPRALVAERVELNRPLRQQCLGVRVERLPGLVEYDVRVGLPKRLRRRTCRELLLRLLLLLQVREGSLRVCYDVRRGSDSGRGARARSAGLRGPRR